MSELRAQIAAEIDRALAMTDERSGEALQAILLDKDDPVWRMTLADRADECARRRLPGWWWPSFEDKPFTARVELCNCGRLFEWAGGTVLAATKADFGIKVSVVPVRDPDGMIVDFVAWKPSDPWSWWVHTADQKWLGLDYAEFMAWGSDESERPAAFAIFETPAQWIAAGRRGMVVLDWRLSGADLLPLDAFERVEVASRELGERLAAAYAAVTQRGWKMTVGQRPETLEPVA